MWRAAACVVASAMPLANGAQHRDHAGFGELVDLGGADFGPRLRVGQHRFELGAAHRLDAAGGVDLLDREQRAGAALLAVIGEGAR